jgi:hypothetical protein
MVCTRGEGVHAKHMRMQAELGRLAEQGAATAPARLHGEHGDPIGLGLIPRFDSGLASGRGGRVRLILGWLSVGRNLGRWAALKGKEGERETGRDRFGL